MKSRLIPTVVFSLAVCCVVSLGYASAVQGDLGVPQSLPLTITSSSTGIALSWSLPTSRGVDFERYDVLRADAIRVQALGGFALLLLVAGVVVLVALRSRRRFLAGGALISLSLAIGVTVFAGTSSIYEVIHSTTVESETTFTDTDLESELGYFYRVTAFFSDGSSVSSSVGFGIGQDPKPVDPDSDLSLRFTPPPSDGDVLAGTVVPSIKGAIESNDRAVTAGELFVNQQSVQSGISGLFDVTDVELAEGPNFVHLTGENDSSKSITIAETISVGQEDPTGTTIQDAFGIVFSPPSPSPDGTTLERFADAINDIPPNGDVSWNAIFDALTYPIEIDTETDDGTLTLGASFTNIQMDSNGDVIVNSLRLVGVDAVGAVLEVDAVLDGITIDYSRLIGDISLGALSGLFCDDFSANAPNRIRAGRVRVRLQVRIFVQGGMLRLSLTRIGSAALLADEGFGADAFDTDIRLVGTCPPPVCPPLCGLDPDPVFFQDATQDLILDNFPVDLVETDFGEMPLGDSGLTVSLALASLRQNADVDGAVAFFDASIGSVPTIDSLVTPSSTPDGAANNSIFPALFQDCDTSPADVGFGITLSDDLLNQGVAAAFAAKLLGGALTGSLLVDGETVPLTVGGLDPEGANAADSLLPNLGQHAPTQADVRIETLFLRPAVIGVTDERCADEENPNDGLRLLITGLQADVFVDVNLNGEFSDSERAVTYDIDALIKSNVNLTEVGGLFFDVEPLVRGYTVEPGFLDATGHPHAVHEALATAVIDDRIERLLTVLNGIGGAGLIIPGVEFITLDAAADGDSTSAYRDWFSLWGANVIDLQALIEQILDLIDDLP